MRSRAASRLAEASRIIRNGSARHGPLELASRVICLVTRADENGMTSGPFGSPGSGRTSAVALQHPQGLPHRRPACPELLDQLALARQPLTRRQVAPRDRILDLVDDRWWSRSGWTCRNRGRARSRAGVARHGPSGHRGVARGRRCARTSDDARSTPRSSKRRPETCRPMVRPSEVKPQLTVAAGWPDMLYGAVKAMCAMPRSSSANGIGRSAGKAATGATGERTRSKGSVAVTVGLELHDLLVAPEHRGPATSRAAVTPPDEGQHPRLRVGRQGCGSRRSAPARTGRGRQQLLGEEGLDRLDHGSGRLEDLGRTRDGGADLGVERQAAACVEVHADPEPADVDGQRRPVEVLGGRLVQSRGSGRLEDRQEQGGVRHRARQRPGGPAQVGRVERDSARARLERRQAQPGAGQPDRPADVGADVERPVAPGGRGPGTGAGPAGREDGSHGRA